MFTIYKIKTIVMRKSILLAALGALSLNYAQAQNPVQKTKGLITEFTETWCTPCGNWGHPTAEDIIDGLDHGNKGYLFAARGSSNPSSLNAKGINALASNYNVTGVPSFYLTQTNFSGNANAAIAAVESFNAAPTVVSAAANFKYTGTKLEVGAKAKFWSAASDEYYMTVFVVEEKLSIKQNGAGSSNIISVPSLRGAMATSGTTLASSPWGEKINLGAVTANTTVYKVYTVDLDPSWVKANLKYYVALYKKTGNTYEIVNIEEAKAGTIGTPTALQDIAGLEKAVIYPNPISEGDASLTVSMKQAATLNMNVTDVNGRVVYTSNNIHFNAGNNNVTIPTQNLSNGVYTVNLIGNSNATYTQKLVVAK